MLLFMLKCNYSVDNNAVLATVLFCSLHSPFSTLCCSALLPTNLNCSPAAKNFEKKAQEKKKKKVKIKLGKRLREVTAYLDTD